MAALNDFDQKFLIEPSFGQRDDVAVGQDIPVKRMTLGVAKPHCTCEQDKRTAMRPGLPSEPHDPLSALIGKTEARFRIMIEATGESHNFEYQGWSSRRLLRCCGEPVRFTPVSRRAALRRKRRVFRRAAMRLAW